VARVRGFFRFIYAVVIALLGLMLVGWGVGLLIDGDALFMRALGLPLIALSLALYRYAFPLANRLFGPVERSERGSY
jgi:hypothetical protein